MEQILPKPPAPIPVVQYDVAALQVKIMSLALMIHDLEKAVGEQASQIQALEEKVAWAIK